jgi:putative endonuclease
VPRPDPVLGRAAEDAAAAALVRAGYRVLARNCVTPFGEIDIVAERKGRLTFVEVKARRDGDASDALTRTKFRRVARAAGHLAASRGLAEMPRDYLGAAVDVPRTGAPGAVAFHPVEDVP